MVESCPLEEEAWLHSPVRNQAFADALESNVIVPKNRKVLSLMFSLFGLFWMERDMVSMQASSN